MRARRAGFAALSTLMLAVLASGCARLGFSSRVLHSVPSPDGRFVAVCQEVPAFDGPDFDIRLHRADGTLVRQLYGIGDGDPCSEVVWSPDSRRLAVLSRHVGRVVLVDVEAAIRNPAGERIWPRTVSLTDSGDAASHLRFATPNKFAYFSCARSLARASADRWSCTGGAKDRRLEL